MSLKRYLLVLPIVIFSLGQAIAQNNAKDTANYPYWVGMMEDPSANYYQTISAFDTYWEGREITKGCGYKPFMRWAADMRNRVKEDGTLESPVVDFIAFEEWKKEKGKLDIIIKPGIGGAPGACPKDGYWEELGPILYPYNSTNQPTGMGRVNAIAFHPTDSNIIYCGAPAGGLWKTTNGGKSWVGLTDDLATLGVSAIHINTSNPNIIYIGTGDRDAYNTSGLGVYKSTNGGNSFSKITIGMNNQTISRFAVDPNNQDFILAASINGIYRSINGGSSWSRTSTIRNFKDIDFKPGNTKTVYATSDGEFYRSLDSGKTFSRITSGLPSTDIYRGAIGVSPDEPNSVYFIISKERVFLGMYKSTNSGTSFSTKSTTPNILGYSAIGSDAGGQAFFDLDIAVNPKNADEVYVGGINIFKSSNAGVDWSIDAHWLGDGGKGEIHSDQHILKFDPHNNNLYVGNDGGVYKRFKNSGKWQEFSDKLAIGQVYRVSAAQTESDFIVNGYQDNGMSYYQGKGSFVTFRGGDGVDNAVDPINSEYYYGSYIKGVISRYGFDDNGDICKKGSNGVTEEGAWVSPYILREGLPTTMITGLKNVWISTNIQTADRSNVSWKKISNNLGGSNAKNIHKLANSVVNNKMLYASREDNKLFRTDDFTANTVSWVDLTSNLPTTGRIVEDVECDPHIQNVVYIIQNKKVYKSTNKGGSWTNISNGLPNITMYDLIIDSSSSDNSMYLATYAGVFYKNDNFSSWVSYFNNLPANVPVRDLEITYNTDASEYRLIAGTYGRGTWQTQLYDNGVNAPEAELEMVVSAICKGNNFVAYNTSDYYPENVSWTVTPNTGVSFVNNTSNTSKDKIELNFTNSGIYELKLVVENCNGKDSITESFRVYDKTKPAFCNSTTTDLSNTYGIGILEFELDEFSTITKGAVDGGANEDYTCIAITELKPSTKYDVYIKTGNSNNESVSIYIDYDNNGTFSSGERVFTSTNARSHSGSFTTPSNSVKGKALRLRVISRFGSNLPTGPCQTFAHGQSEDYSIAILDDKADFKVDKTKICKDGKVTFTDASTVIGTYLWDFGSGASPATANTKGPHNVTYTTSGNKTVKLTLKGTLIEEKTNFIEVKEEPNVSIALIQGTPKVCQGTTVILKATDSKAVATHYEWYRGATKLSEVSNTLTLTQFASNHIGLYTCKAINGACTNTSSALNLSLGAFTTALFSIDDPTQCITNNSFNFTNQSIGTNLTSSWSYGDGNTSLNTSPNHAYSGPGAFQVKLVSTSVDGCKDSITKTVNVNALVDPSFTSNNTSKNVFKFTPTVGTYTSYKWDFDGLGNASLVSPTYDFVDRGTYSVKLVAQNGDCKDSSAKNITAQFNYIGKIPGFENVIISPNPSDGFISLEFTLSSPKELEFDLIDINGKLIGRLAPLKSYSNSNKLQFDLRKHGISAGTYLINIKSVSNSSSIKIIIQ